jgi:hypothetical protein
MFRDTLRLGIPKIELFQFCVVIVFGRNRSRRPTVDEGAGNQVKGLLPFRCRQPQEFARAADVVWPERIVTEDVVYARTIVDYGVDVLG